MKRLSALSLLSVVVCLLMSCGRNIDPSQSRPPESLVNGNIITIETHDNEENTESSSPSIAK